MHLGLGRWILQAEMEFKMQRWIRKIGLWVIVTLGGHYLWPISEKLGEGAVVEWVNHWIAESVGIKSPSQDQLVDFVISWGVPGLAAVVFLCAVYAGRWFERKTAASATVQAASRPSILADFAEHIPDLRVADNPAIRALFEGAEGDKLLPLLEAEKITAWGRKGLEEPPPTKIPGTIWAGHYLFFLPHRGEGTKNQTFIRPNGRYDTVYYDVYLNESQIERAWPGKIKAIKRSLQERKELLAQARNFVTRTVRKNPDYGHFQKRLESDQIFFKLRPHLNEDFLKALTGGRVLVVPPRSDSQLPGIAWAFIREIDRLEKEWRLQ